MALPGLFNLLTEKMAYLTQRQGVISQNIANAATPGYKPKDLVHFEDVLKQAGGTPGGGSGLQMVATNAHHLGGSNGSVGAFKTETEKDLYEVKPNGNAVVLEQQMMNLAQTNTDYSMVTGLYHSTLSMLKTALGKSGG